MYCSLTPLCSVLSISLVQGPPRLGWSPAHQLERAKSQVPDSLLSSTISDASSRGVIYGFGQNANGLYFILTRYDKTVTVVPMEQKEGDTFHVRLVLTPSYGLYVYIDGELYKTLPVEFTE